MDTTDPEVIEGEKIQLTPRDLFTERCYRYLRLVELGAPEALIKEATTLIEQAAKYLTGSDFANAMRAFASNVARIRRIEMQVDAEYPPDPKAT